MPSPAEISMAIAEIGKKLNASCDVSCLFE